MDDSKRPVTRLVPARPDMGEAKRSGFLPRVPWRFLAVAAAVLGAVIGGFNWRQEQRASELRSELRSVHSSDLASARSEYEMRLAKLAGLVSAAAEGPITSHVDPTLNLEALRAKPGLYLRMPLASANSPDAISAAALAMEPDWIPGCLGLSPTTARHLYEIGAFLLPDFVATLDDEDVMKLRVREETLHLRMTRDMPGLRAAMQAPWLMLVLQEGQSRSEAPVRVFVWDLEHDTLLLRAKVRAQGILLTSRILSQGVQNQQAAPGGDSTANSGAAAANDCSIASEVKRVVKHADADLLPH